METSSNLIKQERAEQIKKHGFSLEKDCIYNKNGELLQAALFCKEQAFIKLFGNKQELIKWPDFWNKHFESKIRSKSVIDQLITCGAFYLAEFDRTKNKLYHEHYIDISHLIDGLLSFK